MRVVVWVNVLLVCLSVALFMWEDSLEGESVLGWRYRNDGAFSGLSMDDILYRAPIRPDGFIIAIDGERGEAEVLYYREGFSRFRLYPRRDIVLKEGIVERCRTFEYKRMRKEMP